MSQIDKAKTAIGGVRVRAMSTQVAEVRQHINLIQEAMRATMKKDVHYGIIPGCGKPSLYKPGAEVIIALFKLSTDPIVTDLSKDGEIRYQVKVNISTRDSQFLGSGIGECSSGEEKYMWRAAICEEEFDVTPETMRRIKFKKYQGVVSQVQQIRVNPSDMANTILKMAKKRALIDAVLTATGASDIFSQDIEELPEGYISQEAPATANAIAPDQQIGQEQSPAPSNSTGMISEAQGKRFYAIAKGAGIEEVKAWLLDTFGIESSKEIPWKRYDEVCNKAANYKK